MTGELIPLVGLNHRISRKRYKLATFRLQILDQEAEIDFGCEVQVPTAFSLACDWKRGVFAFSLASDLKRSVLHASNPNSNLSLRKDCVSLPMCFHDEM